MTSIICSDDPEVLTSSDAEFRVLLYGSSHKSPDGLSIGNPCRTAVKYLDLLPDQRAFDFLTIALSVVAADSFILRKTYGVDGFARPIELTISVGYAPAWIRVKNKLENLLNFLTGDTWTLAFLKHGMGAPASFEQKHLQNLEPISKADSVCLFSGGLDSFIGATDLQALGRTSVLVSRASTGDQSFQDALAKLLPDFPRLSVNDNPVSPTEHEISSRARSIFFIALGAIACSGIAKLKQKKIPLIIPENGFIALNPPLNTRRIGASSTRTTHPFYLNALQGIFDEVEIPAHISNPYFFATKGQMLSDTKNEPLLEKVAHKTISCGHWKRAGMQCGRCWPCLIRRASFYAAGMEDKTKYQSSSLRKLLKAKKLNSDLLAALYGLYQYEEKGYDSAPIRNIRYLPTEAKARKKHLAVLSRGFKELKEFFVSEGLLND